MRDQNIVQPSQGQEFSARAPWWGGDLQTLRNAIKPGVVPALSGSTEHLPLPLTDGSGDRLLSPLDTPQEPGNAPLIVLIHGLAGCSESTYIKISANFHLQRGRRVLRLNLRGAGPARPTCKGHYHSGSGQDILDALSALDPSLTANGLFLIGYSLGGSVLINALAAMAGEVPVKAAATISAPINAAHAARRLMTPRNFLYQRWLLRHLKSSFRSPHITLNRAERLAIRNARSIYQFDDEFTAPHNGFADAQDYYAKTRAIDAAVKVTLPLLMIHARNDPWIPPDAYDDLAKKQIRNITMLMPASGGHVGFHDKASNDTWHDRMIDGFINSQC